jgi:GT2 family glycosyltransferase
MIESLIKIEIVIPVYNRRDTTLKGLRSLTKIDTEGFAVNIIIVDDGSTDGTSDAIRQHFPNVRIIQGDGNLHYAAGTNRGITDALTRHPDYIVTANDDAVFHDQFLQRLVKTAKANPRSVIGGLLLLWDAPHIVFQVDFKWKVWQGGWTQRDDLTVFDFPKEAFTVEGLAGNCVLIPVQAVKEVGLMDEKKFPVGWGDIQYFVRMKENGWKLMVEPRSYIWCEPNTYPKPLHQLPKIEIIKNLVANRRHPLNLHRQFIARWESAPTKLQAIIGFIFYLLGIAGKTIKFFLRKGSSPVSN